MKKLYDIGIKECSTCEYHLKCTECALPQQCQDMKAEIENQSENFKKLVAEHRGLQKAIAEKNAEIEKLDAENDCLIKELDKQCDECVEFNTSQARKKAIKEFAERLKERKHECGCNYRKKPIFAVTEEQINNLVKEMVCE